MKTTSMLFVALLFTPGLAARAQTNFSTAGFVLPPMHLRAELTLDSPEDNSTAAPFLVHAVETNSPEREMVASSGETFNALETYNTRSDRLYLTPEIEPPAQSPLGTNLSSIGEPEVLHLGHRTLSCSAITAVKRRNPLCLVNATVLKMTW